MQGAGGPCAVLAPLQAFLLKVPLVVGIPCNSYYFEQGEPGEGDIEPEQLG